MKFLYVFALLALSVFLSGCQKQDAATDDSAATAFAPVPTPSPTFNGFARKRFSDGDGWVADITWYPGAQPGVTCWTTAVGFDASGNPIYEADGVTIARINSLPQKNGYASAVEIPRHWKRATITVFARSDIGGTTSNSITINGPPN